MGGDPELITATGCEVVALLTAGATTPHDLLDALERRIEAVEPAIHALPTLCFDRARRAADALLDRPPGDRGRLAGLREFSGLIPDRLAVLLELVVEVDHETNFVLAQLGRSFTQVASQLRQGRQEDLTSVVVTHDSPLLSLSLW